jgi:hypothetical protein
MLKNKLLLAALVSASMLSVAPLPAAAEVGIYVDVAPPAARYEIVPEARHGYAWQPGYWDYRYNRHHWVKGTWVRERQGYYYHPTRWVQDNGRWHLVRGNWGRERYAYRDSDRDGVPNQYDRDRDGDGVRNSNDRAPDNPYRH